MSRTLLFLSIILTGLVSGTVFGIFVGYNPQELSALAYMEQQQNLIDGLNILMPILGFLAIILNFILAFQYRKTLRAMSALTITAILLIVGGLITHFGNQPINVMVSEWNVDNIPDTWEELRDEWWKFHILRTITSFIAFGFVAWVATIPKTWAEDIPMAH